MENLAHPTEFFSRVAVLAYAPVRGTGVKVKVLESLAYGVPVVTTGEGMEGVDGEDGVHCWIREDDDALAARIVDALGDEAQRVAHARGRPRAGGGAARAGAGGRADAGRLRAGEPRMSGRRAVLVVPEIPTPPRCGNAWRDLQQLDVLRRLGFAVHVVAARPAGI